MAATADFHTGPETAGTLAPLLTGLKDEADLLLLGGDLTRPRNGVHGLPDGHAGLLRALGLVLLLGKEPRFLLALEPRLDAALLGLHLPGLLDLRLLGFDAVDDGLGFLVAQRTSAARSAVTAVSRACSSAAARLPPRPVTIR